jgi:hypothetical protein
MKQARFLSKADEESSVVCVLLGCGRHTGIGFSAPVDGSQSYNNLNITREAAIVPEAESMVIKAMIMPSSLLMNRCL